MTPDQFCYWLQGMFEITNTKQLSETQTKIIKEHLQLVFTKVTPDHDKDLLTEQEESELEEALKKLQDEIDKKYEPYKPYQPYYIPDWDEKYTGNPPPVLPTVICSDGGDKIDTTLFCSPVKACTVTEDWYEQKPLGELND
jgi:hypothetical protein